MNTPNKNNLLIENPNAATCSIYSYVLGHSEMCIAVYGTQDKPSRFIVFSFVEYFSGSTHWKGANLKIGTDDECIEILQNMTRFNKMPSNILASRYKLYIFESDIEQIQLIAAGTYITDKY